VFSKIERYRESPKSRAAASRISGCVYRGGTAVRIAAMCDTARLYPRPRSADIDCVTRRLGLPAIALLLGGCTYHFPTMEAIDRSGAEEVSLLESAAYAVASTIMTVGVHELGHAAMGEILGADETEIFLFGEGHFGFTRLRGDFSNGDLKLIDLAGVMATYGLSELFEGLVFRDVIPERAQPFFATWTLLLKSDLYLQTAQSFFEDDSDLAKLSDRSGFPELGYLGFIGLDLLFHHETYVELFNEARYFKAGKDE
jgi:hypothetical protein